MKEYINGSTDTASETENKILVQSMSRAPESDNDDVNPETTINKRLPLESHQIRHSEQYFAA